MIEIARASNSSKIRLMQLPWTTRLYHFIKGPNPLHPKTWNGRLHPLAVRRFRSDDMTECLSFYTLNEQNRFPAATGSDYACWLTEQSSYVLVAEMDGRLVASGGLHYLIRKDIAILCFGLVHPRFQGMGIGTALVLARLALLNPAQPSIRVLLFAVEKSVGFYRRLGFQHFMPWEDKHGQVHPSGQLVFTSAEIKRCRKLLAEHGISVPLDEKLVPVYDKPQQVGGGQVRLKLCVSCNMPIQYDVKICPNCAWTQPPLI